MLYVKPIVGQIKLNSEAIKSGKCFTQNYDEIYLNIENLEDLEHLARII